MITKIQLGIDDEMELERIRKQLHEQLNTPGEKFHKCTVEEMQKIDQYYIFAFINQKGILYGVSVIAEEDISPNANKIQVPYYFHETISTKESIDLIKRIWRYISGFCFKENKKVPMDNVQLLKNTAVIKKMLFV